MVTGLVGAPPYYLTDKVLPTRPYNIGIPMVLLGLVLIGIGFYIRYSQTKPRVAIGLGEMKLKNYVIIGIAQGIATLPGVSRSGMTVSTMPIMSVKPKQAFRLSYLAYIPASLGAIFVTLILSKSQVDCNSNSPAYRHSHRGFDCGRGRDSCHILPTGHNREIYT